MAGKKGRSGGSRPGAGRKPIKPIIGPDSGPVPGMPIELEIQDHGGALKRSRSDPVPAGDMDMLQYLQDVALGVIESTPLQVKAAIAAIQYTHAKKADIGKREQREEAAKKAANGRFPFRSPPLHAVKRH